MHRTMLLVTVTWIALSGLFGFVWARLHSQTRALISPSLDGSCTTPNNSRYLS
jgi:hypothetical protein